MPHGQPLKDITDKDQRAWRIEEAARTVQEMASISKDPELLTAANKKLKEDQAEIAAGQRMINKMNAQSPAMQVPQTI